MARNTRAKKKKPDSSTITLTHAQLEKIKRDLTKQISDMAIILVLTATADEVGLDYETKGRIGKRTDRYAGYIEDKLVSLRETQKCLEEACERAFSGF